MSKILKKAMLFMLAAIMVCCAAVFAACDDDTDNSGGTVTEKYTVEGVVASELGPLSGVTVKLGNETKTTGSAGSYSFEVSAGEYTLTFTKTGYTDVQKSVKTADAVNGTVKLNVTMTVQAKEYFVISGTVSDEDGAIANATVSGSALSETVTADANGAFTLPQLEKKGSYTFTFAASGYVSVDKTVNAAEIEGSTHTLNVTLEKIPEEQLATVSGVVTADYPAGGLAGVTVKIGTTEVKTGTNGAYSVQTSRDACTVEFIKDGYATVSEAVSAEDVADGEHTLNAELVRNTVLAGKTNAALAEEYSLMKDIVVSGQLKDQIHAGSPWKEGGAEGSAAQYANEGYQMESKQDNANDDYRRYVYGKMTVSADNKIVTLYGRTFSGVATECAVKVIIPDTLESKLIKEKTQNTEWATLNSNTTVSLTFDLSEYVNENIILAIGVRKAALTVERIVFGPGEFVFGRTTQAEFESAKTIDLTRKTSFENAEIRSAFDINGNIEGKNSDNDYVTKSARFYACYVGQNTAADADLFMYAYAKAHITAANARMSVRWYNDRVPFMRVTAFDIQGNVVQSVNVAKGDGDTITSTVDLTDCLNQTVVLAIGMTSGERLDLQKISFARYSYTLKGTVTLPEGEEYDLSKVSFKLENDPLTSGEDGFTYDAATGKYTFVLRANATGTLTVSYNNTGIADETQKLLDATYTLSSAVTQDEITQNFQLQKNSNAPQTIYITLNADTTLTEDDAEIKLGTRAFTYANGKWSLDGLTMAEAVTPDNVTITLKGKYANIYADPSFVLTTADYAGGKAEKTVTLTEKEILPGRTYSQLFGSNTKYLRSDYYVGRNGSDGNGARRRGWLLNNFSHSDNLESQSQSEGEALRIVDRREDTAYQSGEKYYGYIYGRKVIGNAANTLYMYVRRHDGKATFAVTLIDEDGNVWVSNLLETDSTDYEYKYVTFPEEFLNKQVIVAIGVYNTDGHQNQLVFEHLAFYKYHNDQGKSLSQQEWKNKVDGLMAEELEYGEATDVVQYNGRTDKDEIFTKWGMASKSNASGEAAFEWVNEGFMMKTRLGKDDTSDNRAFIYNKFAITASNSYFTMTARSFNTNVEMALTVYYKDGNAVTSQVMKGAYSGSEMTFGELDGNWVKFNDNNKGYATLCWDLHEFDGKDVVIVIGCRNRNQSDTECKLHVGDISLSAVPQTV